MRSQGFEALTRLPAELQGAALPVRFLRVQEESLVKETNIVEGFPTQQDHSAYDKRAARRKPTANANRVAPGP